MAKAIEDAIQLDETIQYPDGANKIRIEGRGDERKKKLFPNIVISHTKDPIYADGSDFTTFNVTIEDPNSADAFDMKVDQWEVVDASDPFSISARYWVDNIIGVWEYNGGDNPLNYDLSFPVTLAPVPSRGRDIRVDADYISPNAFFPGQKGLPSPKVLIRYDGYNTMSVSIGRNKEEEWWLLNPPPVLDIDESSGLIRDPITKQEVSEIPLRGSGQSVTAALEFLPETGDGGIGFVNAAYGGISVQDSVTVIGGTEGLTLTLSADPSSVPRRGTSLVTALVYDSAGPITSGTVTFFLWPNPPDDAGGTLADGSASLGKRTATDEEVTSTDSLTIGVQYPIVKVLNIVDPAASWLWNGNYTIDGVSGIKLEEGNALPFNEIPLQVTYEYGGVAEVNYTAGDILGQTIVKAVYNVKDTLTTIDVVEGTGIAQGLSVEAFPPSIDKEGGAVTTSEIWALLRDPDGYGMNNKRIKFSIGARFIPDWAVGTEAKLEGGLRLTKNKNIVDEATTTQDNRTVTVKYPIASVVSVTVLGIPRTVQSFDKNEIVIPDTGLGSGIPAVVNYVANGIAITTIESGSRDEIDYVNAQWGGLLETAEVTVGAPGVVPDWKLSATATPPAVEATLNLKTREIAQVIQHHTMLLKIVDQNGDPPPTTERVQVWVVDGQALDATGTYILPAGVGEYTVNFTTIWPGRTVILNVKWKTQLITITIPASITRQRPEPVEKLYAKIHGYIDPFGGTYSNITGGTITNFGAGKGADDNGGTDTDPASNPIEITTRGNISIGTADVLSARVVGATLTYPLKEEDFDPFWGDIKMEVPWNYKSNTVQFQVSVTDKITNAPVVNAKVTIEGQTQRTDASGVAKFSGISPSTSERDINIEQPNYRLNRPFKLGLPSDGDTANDKVVVDYTDRDYILGRVDFDIEVYVTVQ